MADSDRSRVHETGECHEGAPSAGDTDTSATLDKWIRSAFARAILESLEEDPGLQAKVTVALAELGCGTVVAEGSSEA